jgi:glycosyltransferase involved in cell wall biosynthesis
VEPGDAGAWREALGKVIASSDLRACLGEGARARAERWFSIEGVADSYLELYRELLGGLART